MIMTTPRDVGLFDEQRVPYQMQYPTNLQSNRSSVQHLIEPAAEIVERRRQADGGLAAVSAAADFSARLHADLTYTFPAANVHEVPLPGCTLTQPSVVWDYIYMLILTDAFRFCAVGASCHFSAAGRRMCTWYCATR
jgi:hypothetical protein